MAKSPYRPFKPKHEQMALVPETSGNTINGFGEEGFRRASPIYWHDPDTLVHGELQKWFYTQDPDNVAIAGAREARAEFLDIEVPPVSSDPLDQSAETWTSDLRAFATTLDMELFGITALKDEWLFERHNLSQKWIIMIGVAHDYDQIKHAPEDLAARGSHQTIWSRYQGCQGHCHLDSGTGPGCRAPWRSYGRVFVIDPTSH